MLEVSLVNQSVLVSPTFMCTTLWSLLLVVVSEVYSVTSLHHFPSQMFSTLVFFPVLLPQSFRAIPVRTWEELLESLMRKQVSARLECIKAKLVAPLQWVLFSVS
jgi:hypothetical protein